MPNIPFFGLVKQYRNLREELLDATDRVLSSGELMGGENTTKFEDWLCNRTGTKYAVTVHSGTQALEIIANYYVEPFKSTFDIEPVIKLPNISYVATLNAFLNAGWKVELADTNSNGIADYSNESNDHDIRNVCLVGLYGANPVGKSIFNYSIVDGAQHWLVADDIGDAMAISFDPTKNLPASGNGGAIVTNDEYLYQYALSFRNNGKYDHVTYGTNSRMSEQDCAQILVRTKYIDKWQWRRKEIRHYYLDEFKNMPFSCLSRDYPIHADQKFVIYTEDRNELLQYLSDKGIETKVHYEQALSELPLARKLVRPNLLSTSVMLCRGVLSLPIYPELTDSEVEYIAKEVKNFFTY